MTEIAPLAAAVAALLVLLLVVGWAGRLGQNRDVLVVSARAVVQLFAIGLVLGAVLVRAALAPFYLGAMLLIAAQTSSRRLRGVRGAFPSCLAAIGAAVVPVAAVVLVTGALTRETRFVVPFLAQMIGGSMTATTLAALALRDDALTRWDLVESRLALGATPRRAVAEVARAAAARALVPALDQTRNVGLVVLPGSYVGLLLAGASPAQAARVQLLVLIGLLAAESVAAVTVTRLLSAEIGRIKPVHRTR